MKRKQTYVIVLCVIAAISIGLVGVVYALETYTFRQTEFEANSECAELLITYTSAAPYDIFTKAPALMKFDQGCDPRGSP
jgi:Na+-translocating ferredoxin:NAD+ oxidoreductase RnfG subunit